MLILASRFSAALLGLFLALPTSASEPLPSGTGVVPVEQAQVASQVREDATLYLYARDVIIAGLLVAFGVKILKLLE